MASAMTARVALNAAVFAVFMGMASHEDDKVPAKVVGSAIRTMTAWDAADLHGLIHALRQTDSLCVLAKDVPFLLKYTPRRKFASTEEIILWLVSASSIREAVDRADQWGFVPKHTEPRPPSLWNAFLLVGLCILAQEDEELIRRESVFHLLSVVGVDRYHALRGISVQKEWQRKKS